jgi:hypothetical protein
MTLRTLSGNFEGKEQEVWSWFVPTFVPTLTLMVGAYAATVRKAPSENVTVDPLFYRVSIGSSAFYLLILTAIVALQGFLGPVLLVFQRGSFALGVLQAVTSACLGVFFVSHSDSIGKG